MLLLVIAAAVLPHDAIVGLAIVGVACWFAVQAERRQRHEDAFWGCLFLVGLLGITLGLGSCMAQLFA